MKKFGNALWGVVLVVIGLIIGGNRLGITNIDLFFDGWWTLFIIIPCFIGIFKESDKMGNIIGLLIGVALLLACQDILDFNLIWKMMFPTILIAIGLSIIFKDAIGGKVSKEIKKLNENKTGDNNYCSTFAGQKVNFDNQEFTGADLSAIFGGIECDLRKAIITKDVVINAQAIFGGIDIFAPNNVKIKIKSTPIFGGVSDKSSRTVSEDSPTIYINAQAVFGGVEIK